MQKRIDYGETRKFVSGDMNFQHFVCVYLENIPKIKREQQKRPLIRKSTDKKLRIKRIDCTNHSIVLPLFALEFING